MRPAASACRATTSGSALDPLGEPLPQHVDDPPVELLARALEQRLVRRLLHERVLERVRRLRRLAAHEHQLRLDEARQPLRRPRRPSRPTAASSVYENSRPSTAARCATSFALERRSSRAISESCNVTGMLRAAHRPGLHHRLRQLLGE